MPRHSMREEIVEAALAQFRAHGFNAAGVKDITDAAHAPKGSFYNHFESKEALALVALERYGATRRIEDLADRRVEPLERLRKHFEFLRDELAGFDFTQGCLIGNFGTEIVDHSATIRTGVQHSLEAWRAPMAALLAEAVQAGAVDPGLDPQATSLFILSAWQGAVIAARTQRSSEAFDAFFDVVFGKLLAKPACSTPATSGA